MSHSSLSTYSISRIWHPFSLKLSLLFIFTTVLLLWNIDAWAVTDGSELKDAISKVDSAMKDMLRPALYGIFAVTAGISTYKQNPTGIGVAVIGIICTKFGGNWIHDTFTLII